MQKKQLEVSPFLQKNATLLKVALAAAEGIKLDTAVASTSASVVSPSAARAMAAEAEAKAKATEAAPKAPPPSPEGKTAEPKVEAPKVEAPKAPNTINHPHATKPITVSTPKPAPKPERPTVQVIGGRWF